MLAGGVSAASGVGDVGGALGDPFAFAFARDRSQSISKDQSASTARTIGFAQHSARNRGRQAMMQEQEGDEVVLTG